MLSTKIFILVLPLTLLCFSEGKGRVAAQTSDACDMLYVAALYFRDNVLNNQFFKDMHSIPEDEIRDKLEEMQVDLSDDRTLKALACAVVDATTLAQLAQVLKCSTDELEMRLEYINQYYMMFRKSYHLYRKGFGSLHRWLKLSGFPDHWPLKASMRETQEFLETTDPLATNYVVLKFGGGGKSTEELAQILTGSHSLDEYLTELDMAWLIDSPNLTARLYPARALTSKDNLRNFLYGLKSLIQMTEAVHEIKNAIA